MIREEDVLRIGQLGKPHGVRGEINLACCTDAWAEADDPHLLLRIDGILVPFFLQSWRPRGEGAALVKFHGYDTPEQLAELRGREVCVERALLPEDEEADDDLIGYRIVDTERGDIGTVDWLDDSTQNVLLGIGDLLIPLAEEYIQDVDHEARVITMKLPQGLLDL